MPTNESTIRNVPDAKVGKVTQGFVNVKAVGRDENGLFVVLGNGEGEKGTPKKVCKDFIKASKTHRVSRRARTVAREIEGENDLEQVMTLFELIAYDFLDDDDW